MEYVEYSKDQQKEFLKAQITDLESQHFQQTAMAESAEAAADAPPPAKFVEATGTGGITQAEYETYVQNNRQMAFNHRHAAAEAERRVAALRAALSLIEGDKATKNSATKPKP